MWAAHLRKIAQDAVADVERDAADRQVDPEDHRPGQMLGEEAAEHGAGDAGARPHRRNMRGVAGALARAGDVGDDRLRKRGQARRRRRPAAGGRGSRSAWWAPARKASSRREKCRAPAAGQGGGRECRRTCRRAASPPCSSADRRRRPRAGSRRRRAHAPMVGRLARRWSGRARRETSPPARR